MKNQSGCDEQARRLKLVFILDKIPMKKIRAHVIISGRVQGVCFRQYTFQKAIGLGLKGWVRNLMSGEVEAVFEGEEDYVNQMLEWCNEGPSLSRVTHVEVEKQPCLNSFYDFSIRSTY